MPAKKKSFGTSSVLSGVSLKNTAANMNINTAINESPKVTVSSGNLTMDDVVARIRLGLDAAEDKGVVVGDGRTSNINKVYGAVQDELDKTFDECFDMSNRLLAAPHQFLSKTDPRFGSSGMGRMYAEKIMMDAPIVYMKPGTAEFLPGRNSDERTEFINVVAECVSGNDGKDKLLEKLNSFGKDTIQYYGLKPNYSGFMNHVNTLCRQLAVLEGLDNVKVPWTKGGATFGNYDWRNYRMEKRFDNNVQSGNVLTQGFSKVLESIANFNNDYEYIQFYSAPESSFSNSFSNSTTGSVLENLTQQAESAARELNTIGAISGTNIDNFAEDVSSVTNELIEKFANVGNNNSAVDTLLRRLGGAINGVMLGGHFILPEMWSGSSSDNDFSFSIHCASPYGNTLAKYINVGVPMMFALATVLPIQQSANVISSPFLFQVHMPGWYQSSMCLVNQLSIEKVTDGSGAGTITPNEVKISFSIKDLYHSLAMPKPTDIGDFLSNTGMLEYLAVTAGMNISRQEITSKWDFWRSLLENSILNVIQDTTYNTLMAFKHHASGVFKLLK